MEASAVNTDIAKEAEAAEKLAHSKLQSRQEALDTADFDRELSKLLASNDSVQRKTSSLRQVGSIPKCIESSTICIKTQKLLKTADSFYMILISLQNSLA